MLSHHILLMMNYINIKLWGFFCWKCCSKVRTTHTHTKKADVMKISTENSLFLWVFLSFTVSS